MTGRSYRLLSEAEWEYAARAGTTTAHFWGDDTADGDDYCKGCELKVRKYFLPLPVGSLKPNDFGLYDMEGNVWQLVEDCYHADYRGAPTDGSSWSDEDCEIRVSRGGAANAAPRPPRVGIRVPRADGNRVSNVGFRIARTLNSESNSAP
jgi:formylglycine-generating enzyme required for sulfatase activity